jgi:hypothetical protein
MTKLATKRRSNKLTLALLLGWRPSGGWPDGPYPLVRERRPGERSEGEHANILFGEIHLWAATSSAAVQYDTHRITTEVTTE